jgi:hypothetical protein
LKLFFFWIVRYHAHGSFCFPHAALVPVAATCNPYAQPERLVPRGSATLQPFFRIGLRHSARLFQTAHRHHGETEFAGAGAAAGEQRRDAMLRGEAVNHTENRAVLHTVLRLPKESFMLNGQNIAADVHAVLTQMREFANAVREGRWLGYTGDTHNCEYRHRRF